MNDESTLENSPPPPPPLVGYYEGRVPLKALTAAIAREGAAAAPNASRNALVDRLPDLDSDLAKTWGLAKTQLARADPSRVISDWVRVVLQRLRGDLGDAATPAQAFGDVLPELLPSKGKPSKRAFHVLKLLALDLRWRRGLGGDELAKALTEHFVSRRDTTDALERQAIAALLKIGAVPGLRSASRTLGWSARLSAEQTAELAEVRKQLAAASERNTTLTTEVASLRTDLQSLQRRNAEAGERIGQSQQALQDYRNAATLRLQDLCGQMSGRLAGRVSVLLTQADDALALNEPSIRAAQQFIQLVRTEIEELKQWLGAESTSGQQTA